MVTQVNAALPRAGITPVQPGSKNTEHGQTLEQAVELDRDVLDQEKREQPKKQPKQAKPFPVYNHSAGSSEICPQDGDVDVTA